MEIYFDNDGLLNIKRFSGDNIWMTNKTDGLWMYGVLPEKVYPIYIDTEIVKFEIPIKERKYGDNWQINGFTKVDDVTLGKGIELISKSPLNIKFYRDNKSDDIKVKEVTDDSIVLTRSLRADERVIVKRRINTNHGGAYFSDQMALNMNDDCNICAIDVPEIVKLLHITEEDIIDFFVRSFSSETRLVTTDLMEKRFDNSYIGTSYKIYRNGLKSLSIYFYAKKAVYTQKIQWLDGKLRLTFEDDTIARNISDIVLAETTKKSSDSSIRLTIPLKSNVVDNSIVIYDDLISNEMIRRNKFSFRLLFSYKNSKIKNQFWTDKNEKISSDDNFELKNISINKFLALELTSKKREKTTKIAVLGSSHTRPMFTSSYFLILIIKTIIRWFIHNSTVQLFPWWGRIESSKKSTLRLGMIQ